MQRQKLQPACLPNFLDYWIVFENWAGWTYCWASYLVRFPNWFSKSTMVELINLRDPSNLPRHPPEKFTLGGCIKYVLFSLPNIMVWRNFKLYTTWECLEGCKKIYSSYNQTFKWNVENVSFHYPVFYIEKVVQGFSTPNLIWLGGNSGGWQVCSVVKNYFIKL